MAFLGIVAARTIKRKSIILKELIKTRRHVPFDTLQPLGSILTSLEGSNVQRSIL